MFYVLSAIEDDFGYIIASFMFEFVSLFVLAETSAEIKKLSLAKYDKLYKFIFVLDKLAYFILFKYCNPFLFSLIDLIVLATIYKVISLYSKKYSMAMYTSDLALFSKCPRCSNKLENNTCPKCGCKLIFGNSSVLSNLNYVKNIKNILKCTIEEEFKNQNEDSKMLTVNLNKKKNIIVIVFSFITFLNMIGYFLNNTLLCTFIIQMLIILIYLLIMNSFTIVRTICKRAIKYPDADISRMVKSAISTKTDYVKHNYKLIIACCIALALTFVMFFNPKTIYKSYGDGYELIRYTRSIVNNNEVTIPNTHKEKKVISIGDNAFKNNPVKKVNLPYGLLEIKAEAFKNCIFESIEIPGTVTEIRTSAFENCNNLKTVKLNEGLLSIRASAFANNKSLIDITLPNSLTYLGASSFMNCSSLKSVTIPSNVTEINGLTFAHCTSLEKINFHDDIVSIHGEVFVGDTSLRDVVLPPKITEIKGNTFEGCTALTSIIIPEGVTRIGGHAFHGCTGLADVEFPSTILEIGSSAFRDCISLWKVKIPIGTYVNDRAFKGSSAIIERYSAYGK